MNMAGIQLGKPVQLFLFGEANIIFFFIHSGFILSYTFTRRNRSLSFRSYARFLVERIFRIYPLFLAMLVVSFIVFSNVSPYTARNEADWVARFWFAETGISDLLKQAILVVRLPESANLRLVPQDWTLTIELLAGAGIPLMAMAGKKHIILYAAVLAALKLSGLFTTYVFEFGMGVLIFLYWENIVNAWKKIGLPLKVLLAVATVGLFSGCFTYPHFFAGSTVFIEPRVDRLIVGLGCMLCFILLLSSTHLQKFMTRPVFVYTGKICYSIYLVHQVLFLACWREFPSFLGNLAEQPGWQIVSIYLLLLLAVMLISSLAYYLVENPMNLLGKRLSALMAGERKLKRS